MTCGGDAPVLVGVFGTVHEAAISLTVTLSSSASICQPETLGFVRTNPSSGWPWRSSAGYAQGAIVRSEPSGRLIFHLGIVPHHPRPERHRTGGSTHWGYEHSWLGWEDPPLERLARAPSRSALTVSRCRRCRRVLTRLTAS